MADSTDPGVWVIVKHPPWVPFGQRDEIHGTYPTKEDANAAFNDLWTHWEPFCSYTVEHRAK
jgi:hypothetical protein